MSFPPKTRITLSQIVSMGQSDEVDEKVERKQEIWARMKANEKKRGGYLLGIVLALGLRLTFTDVETRTLRFCGHTYDDFKCTQAKEGFTKLGEALTGPVIPPWDERWGGVPDVLHSVGAIPK